MQDRWYQTEAQDKTLVYIDKFPTKHPLIVCPTGAGKSRILSNLAAALANTGARVLIVSHVEDILTQDEAALLYTLPREIVGVYASSLNRRERKIVTVASIQSIYKKYNLFSGYKYIIVDEAHTIPLSGNGMYRQLISGIENCVVIGLTATPFRLGSGYLVEGDDALFNDIVFDVPVERLIKEGYLSPLLSKSPTAQLDTDSLKTVAGDFSKKDMSDQLDQFQISEKIISDLVAYRDKYKSWILFAIDIAHCEHITTLLQDNGIKASLVHSKQKKVERRANIADFKAGRIQALVSVATLTTGFDHPAIDLVGIIRPTQSPVLHIQMIGRGLRIAEGKSHCLILDFAGNIPRLGPINDVHIAMKRKGKSKKMSPSIRTCLKCRTHVPLSALSCYECGYVFPPPPSKLNEQSGLQPIVLEDKTKEKLNGWHPVVYVSYSSFMSRNKNLSMRVAYTLGNKMVVYEYINPFAKTKSGYNNVNWWKFRTDIPLPTSINGMVSKAENLSKPKVLKLNFSCQYPQIIDASF